MVTIVLERATRANGANDKDGGTGRAIDVHCKLHLCHHHITNMQKDTAQLGLLIMIIILNLSLASLCLVQILVEKPFPLPVKVSMP